MLAPLLALALAAAPPPDWDEDMAEGEGKGDSGLRLSALAGASIELGGGGRTFALGGAALSYDFGGAELGVLAQAYNFGSAAASPWSPVLLLRFDQRFETRRGVYADLGFGAGAGRTDRWELWFLVSLGVRFERGPFGFGAEVGFEQNQLLRLAGSLSLRL